MTQENALRAMETLPYVLCYRMSELVLKPVQEVDLQTLFDADVLEGRCFGPKGEIHWWRADNGDWKIVETWDDNEAYMDAAYRLSSYFKNMCGGKTVLQVRRLIGYDEDGQAYIERTRLYDLSNGKEVQQDG